MKHLKFLAVALLAMAVFFAVLVTATHYALTRNSGGSAAGLPRTPDLFSNGDVITLWFGLLGVMVALASIVLTGVGIGVAALSIFGYQEFRRAISNARDTIVEAAKKAGEDIARQTADRIISSSEMKEIRARIDPLPPDDLPKAKSEKRLARRYHKGKSPKDEDNNVT